MQGLPGLIDEFVAETKKEFLDDQADGLPLLIQLASTALLSTSSASPMICGSALTRNGPELRREQTGHGARGLPVAIRWQISKGCLKNAYSADHANRVFAKKNSGLAEGMSVEL